MIIYNLQHKKTKKKHPYVKSFNSKVNINGKIVKKDDMVKDYDIIDIKVSGSTEELESEMENTKF